MKTLTLLLALATLPSVVSAADAAAEQWPQWRGPLTSGVAPSANPPVKWSETENVKWKVALPGVGTSTPIVWADRVFLATAVKAGEGSAPAAKPTPSQPAPPVAAGEGGPERRRRGGPGGPGGGMRSEAPSEKYQFAVVCLDRASGTTLWKKTVREEIPHEGHHRDHGYASASPVTDGKLLYAYFGSRGLYAMDFEGNVKWEKDFGDMQTRNNFGEGGSPALYGDTLVVSWDHEGDDFIVALDKTSGKELWRKQRDEATNWTTPYVVEHDGTAQVVVNGTNKVRSYALKTGDLLWEAGGQTANAIPTVVSGHGLLIAMSGFRGSAVKAIKLGGSGDLTDSVAWSYDKGTPYVPSPLLYGDELYFLGGNTAMLSILDAKTGTRHLEAGRLSGLNGVYASPVGAAGRVYITGRDGGFVVIKAGRKLEVLATNKLDDRFDASPAAVGKELFLRGHQYLYCIAEK